MSQSETVFDFGGWRYNPDFRRNNEEQNTREQYHQQPDQRPSTSSTPPQTSSKPPDKTFEYKGKQNIGRPKGQYKGNDGAPIRAMQTVEIARKDTIEQDSDTSSNKDPNERKRIVSFQKTWKRAPPGWKRHKSC